MTEEELKRTRKERDDIRRKKDEIIAELQFKIDNMESAYESVLHVCMTFNIKSCSNNVTGKRPPNIILIQKIPTLSPKNALEFSTSYKYFFNPI